MAFSLSLPLPWRRRAVMPTAAVALSINRTDLLLQRRAQAHCAYIASIGDGFGVDLPQLSTAQFIALSRFVSSQQHAGLPMKSDLLASLAGIIFDLAVSDDTIALRLKQAPVLRTLTQTPMRKQVCADLLRRGLAAVAGSDSHDTA